jgi:lysozyme family protein
VILGARLIAVSAVYKGGVIKESIWLDKVVKAAVVEDYHANVNRDGELGSSTLSTP